MRHRLENISIICWCVIRFNQILNQISIINKCTSVFYVQFLQVKARVVEDLRTLDTATRRNWDEWKHSTKVLENVPSV